MAEAIQHNPTSAIHGVWLAETGVLGIATSFNRCHTINHNSWRESFSLTADDIGLPRRAHYQRHARGAVSWATRQAARLAALAAAERSISYLQTDEQVAEMSKRRRPPTEYDMAEYGSVPRPVKRYVKRCMSTMLEKKQINIQNVIGNSGVPTTSGRVDPIQSFNILQGTTDDDRQGNFVTLTRLDFRFLHTLPADLFAGTYRFVIFRDRQTNGATPAITDILTTGTGGVLCGYNADNTVGYGGTRFKVLTDRIFVINSTAGTGVAAPVSQKTHVVRKRGKWRVQFDASAGAITDIVSGEVFVATICSQATGIMQCQMSIGFQDD